MYDGHSVGHYFADLWVNERIIIELKAVRAIAKEHEIQLVNCLTATQVDIGLLLNFGPSVEIKRKFREFKPKGSTVRLTSLISNSTCFACASYLVNPVNPVRLLYKCLSFRI